jgi:hypothetical protein
MRQNLLSLVGMLCLPSIHSLPPLCVNCRFFKADPFMSKYGKCTKFPNENDPLYFLVNGKADFKSNYYYCSTARSVNAMCGPQGKLFEPRYLL